MNPNNNKNTVRSHWGLETQLRRLYTVCPECSCTTYHWYARDVRSISHQSCSRSIGYRSGNGFCLRWRFWSTSASMGVHQPTWLMTAAGSATAGPAGHDETGCSTDQNDVRRPIVCCQRTAARLEQSTGVNSQPHIVTNCFS